MDGSSSCLLQSDIQLNKKSKVFQNLLQIGDELSFERKI